MGKMVVAGARAATRVEAGSEPKFSANWSRNRTKIDRTRNTDIKAVIIITVHECWQEDSMFPIMKYKKG
jgi:hypothetical protein